MNYRCARSLLLVLAFLSALLLRADEPLLYLADSAPDAVLILPPPPPPDSAEQKAELETVRRVHTEASAAQLTAAKADIAMNVFSFAAVIGPWFTPANLPRTQALFQEVERETRTVTNAVKEFYQRPRPYVVDATIVPLAPEKSFSFPSGHSTRGTVYALVLADLLPEKRDALLDAGREIGFHREVAGVHFPSDVYGGRTLGRAIAQALLKNARFQADLVAVRAELAQAPR